MAESVNITFGIIVLNGEPFTRFNLRALYPWAHEIIVVEGACPSAVSVASQDGHSTDSTLTVIREFIELEDIAKKVTLVTAEDEGHKDGFWSEKDEMSKAYAKRATGNYLWQVDIDEFYLAEDMHEIVQMLRLGDIDAMSFHMLQFWGHPSVVVNGFTFLTGYNCFHRLFRWGPGFEYTSHRPPTVIDASGVDLRTKHWVTHDQSRSAGFALYHYSLLFPRQAREKCEYYSRIPWSDVFREANIWFERSYTKLETPFRAYIHPNLSWLERFCGKTPDHVAEMYEQSCTGLFPGVTVRPTMDIDALLASRSYACAISILKRWVLVVRMKNIFVDTLKRGAGLLGLLGTLKSIRSCITVNKRKRV